MHLHETCMQPRDISVHLISHSRAADSWEWANTCLNGSMWRPPKTLSILIQHCTLQLRVTFCSRSYLESIKQKSLQSEIILKLSQLPNLPLHCPSWKNGAVNKNSVPKTLISMFIYNILLLLICANGPVVIHINVRTLAGKNTDTATLTCLYRVIMSKLFAFA